MTSGSIRSFPRAAASAVALLASAALCAGADSSQALLDLLVRKGLVTAQEAAQLQQEAAANAAASSAAQPPPPGPSSPPTPATSAPAANTAGPAKGIPPTTDIAGSPLAFRIGAANFTPLGFVDFTGVYRSTVVGSGIGTSFGSIPYSNTNSTTIGPLSETRFSAQNSRLGLRVDSNVGDWKVLGYTEADFLGNAANNLTTVSNSDTLRMRVYFADVRNTSGWEVLAGQDWSMLTPNRKGLSPVPGDIFFSQNMDTNYQVGLIWSRQPQLRIVYHAGSDWTMGVSFENPDQYVGSAATLPTTNFNANQVDISAGANSSGTTNANVAPDVIGKVAYDTKFGESMSFHADAAGFLRQFKIDTYGGGGAVNVTDSATGYGGSFNMQIGLLPNLNLVENAFVSRGGGRYISTGLGPDFVVGPADAATGGYKIGLETADAAMLGFEYNPVPVDMFFGYWGAAYYGRKEWQTGPTSYLGYGYVGSSNSNNKDVEEYTLGNTYTFWKNPAYGSLALILQASYLTRKPWYVAPGALDSAHTTMFYFDLRYTLP